MFRLIKNLCRPIFFVTIVSASCHKEYGHSNDVLFKKGDAGIEAISDTGQKDIPKGEKEENTDPVILDFNAEVLGATRETIKNGNRRQKKLNSFQYKIMCTIDNKGTDLLEDDLSISAVLYVGGETKQKEFLNYKLKDLFVEKIDHEKPEKIKFPIQSGQNGYRYFSVYVPNVPKTSKRAVVIFSLMHKKFQAPISKKILILHKPGEDDEMFWSKANDKKWWWLTSGLAAVSLSLGAVAIGIAL